MDLHSANRNLNSAVIQRGILKKIIYPTGGYTEFFYEPNVIDSSYYGGLRIHKIEDHAETGVFNKKIYQYEQPIGRSFSDNLGYFIKHQGMARSYHSSPIIQPGDLSEAYKAGYFYGKVVVNLTIDNETYKKEYFYEDNNYNLQSYQPVIKAERIKNSNNQIVKTTEYINNIVGNITNYEWNTLGDNICYYYLTLYRSLWSGYSTTPRKVEFSGNYAYLPTEIITTEYVNGNKPITVVKTITYDPETLLKKKEITDFRYKRTGDFTYVVNDNKAEQITVDYTYPFDVNDFNHLPDFPKSTVIKQEITTTKAGANTQTGGKAFVFDDVGNIKTVYEFAKGAGSSIPTVSYVPSDYEERTRFIFKNGFPVEVRPYLGSPTSYVWNLKGNVPVAKIEGRFINSIDQNLISPLENSNLDDLPGKLNTFRAALLAQSTPVLLTTFAYTPLHGVSVITDPKGDAITFEYDNLGRLKLVRDSYDNILSENEYKYALEQP